MIKYLLLQRVIRKSLILISFLFLFIWMVAPIFMNGEDEINQPVPYLIVLGGGIGGQREQLVCDLFKLGHGKFGVVVTGGDVSSNTGNRLELLSNCGIPSAMLISWPATINSYQEMLKVSEYCANKSSICAIIVSDSLHMPRLHFLRDKLGLNRSVLFKQSHFVLSAEPSYVLRILKFWFREPVAYIYYRLKYL